MWVVAFGIPSGERRAMAACGFDDLKKTNSARAMKPVSSAVALAAGQRMELAHAWTAVFHALAATNRRFLL